MKPHVVRTDAQVQQDHRIGRHRDKLEIIRDSLKPFEQQNGEAVSEATERQMTDALVRIGYDKDAAIYALRSTNFHGVSEAKEFLQRLNSIHGHNTGALNGNLHPALNTLDEQTSSRSTSPSQQPALRSPHRQLTPTAPEYHRTHVHVTRLPSYNSEVYQRERAQAAQGERHHPSIMIERFPDMNSRAQNSPRKSILESANSAPAGSSQVMVGGMTSTPYSAHPVIRTVFSSAPRNNTVSINVRPGPSGERMYRFEVAGRSGISTAQGTSAGTTAVQNIIVDPDQTRAFVGYEDELRPSTSTEHPPLQRITRVVRPRPSERTSPRSPVQVPLQQPQQASEPVIRCTSPLPESLSSRIRDHPPEERYVKPCQPRMYCFYMEQHVERMLQQHKDRVKRAFQLKREMELANLPENMKNQMLSFLQQKESKYMRLRRQKINVNMFEVIQHIGVGAFGKVSLVKKKDTGQYYAMKSLLKKDVIVKQQAAHVKAERDILSEADSPWIVKLFCSFQDDRSLYFVMEYVPGGDMMQLLITKQKFEEKLARFYIAELTCAIGYVHSLGFIHRDLKPDNILIDQQGHLKLTDFGLCTGLRWTHDKRYYGPENDTSPSSHVRVDSFSLPPEVAGMEQNMKVLHIRHQKKRDQAHSVVGTGNYMAPEVILRTGHTQLCDWWSVGVILYEMVYGHPPFWSEDPSETPSLIINWRRYLDTSPRAIANGGHVSHECVSMIRGLCRDREDRLGMHGADEVKQHPWFRGIDFINLRNTRAEFIPTVTHAADTSNFETFVIKENDFETLSKRAPNNPAFYEFTFRHFFDTDAHGCPSLRPPQKRPSLAPLFESNRPLEFHSDSDESLVV